MEQEKLAVAYIRVSTEGQAAEDKFGAEAQRKAIEEYAKKNGYKIVNWYEEVGSGAKERPILEGVVFGTTVNNPPIEAVIVYKNDRIARETKLYFYYLYQLERKGIKLISVREEFDDESEFANVYRALLQFVAEQERKNIKVRTAAGRQVKAQSGGYSGGRCPYGYRIENGRYVIEPEEAEMIREVFSLVDGGFSDRQVAEKLNQKGYKTRSGNDFKSGNIYSIVNNRRMYEGYFRYSGSDWVKGEHEAIIKETI